MNNIIMFPAAGRTKFIGWAIRLALMGLLTVVLLSPIVEANDKEGRDDFTVITSRTVSITPEERSVSSDGGRLTFTLTESGVGTFIKTRFRSDIHDLDFIGDGSFEFDPAGGFGNTETTLTVDVSSGVTPGTYIFFVYSCNSKFDATPQRQCAKDSAKIKVLADPHDAIETKLDNINLGNLDRAVSSRATQISVDTIAGDVDVIDAKLDALGLTGAGFASALDALSLSDTGFASAIETKLLASDAASNRAQLGTAVSVSGNTAVLTTAVGTSYVFVHSAGVWTEQAKLARGGESVSVSGNTAVIGSPRAGGSGEGQAYVFVRSGRVWTQQATLTAADGFSQDRFGESVSVSGHTAVIGAFLEDGGGGTPSNSNQGAAYVFVRSGGVWTEEAKLTTSDAAASDFFGRSVSVSGDTAVIGADGDNVGFVEPGSAYVWVRNNGVWTEQAKLIASDGAHQDGFGISVSVNGDTAVIGAEDDDDAGSRSGSAYVFVRSGVDWTELVKLTASDADQGDRFGGSVSVSGNAAVVGAFTNGAGAAYLFVREVDNWAQLVKLTASDAGSGDQFGRSVSISGDTAVVGAKLHDGDPFIFDQGAAYVYEAPSPHELLQDTIDVIEAKLDGLDLGGLDLSNLDAVESQEVV